MSLLFGTSASPILGASLRKGSTLLTVDIYTEMLHLLPPIQRLPADAIRGEGEFYGGSSRIV